MAKLFFLTSKTLKATICLFLLAIALGCANSARILDEETPQNPFPAGAPQASDAVETDEPDVAPVVAPAATLASSQNSATPAANVAPVAGDAEDAPADVANTATTPAAKVQPVATPAAALPSSQNSANPAANVAPVAGDAEDPPADVANTATTPAANVQPVATPAATVAGGAAAAGGTSATVGNTNPDHPPLSFFMHDILGGSHPSGRVVTGVVTSTVANGLPFSQPNNQLFPVNGGVPLNTINNVINNNNFPFLVGLNGSPTNTLIQNTGNNDVVNGGGNQPFVSAGQLPAGLTLQQLMFGSATVVDNELTEGYELGTAVIGRAQGFYLASSQDGSSHTLALTALFHSGEHKHEIEDTISFFGVHRTATPVSHLAVIGGTGMYENAKGHATIETDLHHEDQHTTDGVETITHFTVYLTP